MTTYVISSGVSSNGLTLNSGDTMEVLNGGSASGTFINSGGGELVNPGGTDTGATVNAGGELLVSGTAEETLVNAGRGVIFAGGTETGATVENGGNLVLSGGSAYNTMIGNDGVLIVASGGNADLTQVLNPGTIYVAAGGQIDLASLANSGNAVVSQGGSAVNTMVNFSGRLVVQGGDASFTKISSGGVEQVSSGGDSSAFVDSGGIQQISAGGTALGATVFNGGQQFVFIGGGATSATIEAGGFQVVSGGTASDTLVSSGGQQDVLTGGSAVGTIVDSGATIYISGGNVSGLDVLLGGQIDLATLADEGSGSATLNSSTDVLTVVLNHQSVSLQLEGNYSGEYFHISRDATIDTLITVSDTPCYCRGTRILTDHGEVPVEEMKIGDRLITAGGKRRKLRWIGRRAYDGRFIAGNRDVLPILFRTGSLADAVPARDLYVSPLHAMYLDGVLIPAWVLVNGSSIVQMAAVEMVEYFHLELASHDVILAEGAAAESFIDDEGGRGQFQNAAEFEVLYPNARSRAAEYCVPRLESGDVVERVRARLAERAAASQPKPRAAAPAIRIISRLIPAGAAAVRINRATVAAVVLDGERLEPGRLRWIGEYLMAIEPVAATRWCHFETTPKQAKRRA